jgi:hypothetical protein
MSELGDQIQKHYDAQSLPAARAESILAEGRAGGGAGDKVVALPVPRPPWRRVAWALAASILVVATIAMWWLPQGLPQRGGVSYRTFAPRVVAFFGTPPELPKRSQNPDELRAWLLAQGAPADFQIPPKLRALKSFGCQVVDVHGRPAYLTCFWAEKKPGVDDGSLVHLFVARREDFQDAPQSGAPQFRELNGWSFAAWSDGDVIYTMAENAPLEKLRTFVRAVGGDGAGPMLAALRRSQHIGIAE